MLAGSAPQTQAKAPPSRGRVKKAFFNVSLVLLIGLVIVLGIWNFGTWSLHEQIPHPLYSSFDASLAHSKLLGKLLKNKLSILYGSRADGLIQYSEHVANKIAKQGKPVILQRIDPQGFGPIQIIRHFRSRINELVQLEDIVNSSWILHFQGEPIVIQQIVTNIQSRHPNSRIIVVAAKDHKISGFKSFKYLPIDGEVLSKIIKDKLKVSKNVAAALEEHFQTHESVYTNLHKANFSHQQLLGQDYRKLEGLSKKDRQLLSSLCVAGNAKSKETTDRLAQLGVISYKGVSYWSNTVSRLNYELTAEANCKNSVVPEQILKKIEADKQREAEKKAREEQQKRQEEEKQKLQEIKRLQEEQKKKLEEEEKQRLQQESKKKLQEQAKTKKTQNKPEQAPKKQSKKKPQPKSK